MTSASPNPQTSLQEALARLFKTNAAENASWITLPGGSTLFCEGEASDHLYLLQTGRLGAFRHNEEGLGQELIGIIKPGEPVGEMSLIADTCHASSVVALRDSELLAMPKADFLEAISRVPDVLLALSRKMILRAREGHHDHARPNVFAFFGLGETHIRSEVDAIALALGEMGYSAIVIDHTYLGKSADAFSKVEETHDYVLYVGQHQDRHWNLLAARQVDHVFLMADASLGTEIGQQVQFDPHSLSRPPDLVLLHAPETISQKQITNTHTWLDALKPARWFHDSPGLDFNAQKFARILCAQSVGLVCSGGGARAYAHIGAIQALRDAKVPLDFLCGASMGAIIAATVAMGWSQDEIDAHIQAAFVETSPLDDIAFPLLAMTHGHKVDARLKTHFGDICIEDMPLPFFCISSNLTTGEIKTHRTGLLREALRASIALPGVMPPVIQDGHVLVDGAVMRSFPAGMMRSHHYGSVVGIDVTRARGLDPKTIAVPKNLPAWIMGGAWRQGPPIVSILMRSATITSAADLALSRQATDLLIIPEPKGVEIRDWHAYNEAVECGYQACAHALGQLPMPVALMRKHNHTQHPAVPAFTPDDGVKAVRIAPPVKTKSKRTVSVDKS